MMSEEKKKMIAGASGNGDYGDSDCAVCGIYGTKLCPACNAVRYCSEKCQRKHWNSGHKVSCNITSQEKKASDSGDSSSTKIALVPDGVFPEILRQTRKILFPYDEFVELFHWRNIRGEAPPRGLVNSGNSCYASVVLQCLKHTRPLLAYLMEKGGHREQCGQCNWCLFCAFEIHVEKAMTSEYPLTPKEFISKLPRIGGSTSDGQQEDAHEFLRLLTATMQSLCIDEFGGEKAIQSSSVETTLIQHIFGGCLQSQVICTKCSMLSTQYENIMDLTVEIQGNSSSLEQCLEQHTRKECLDGDNMYKCTGCNDHVKAWKRLCIRQAPNVLSIAFKRYQGGSSMKLNKRITFPETLDLGPYMTRPENGSEIYELYAVVVHLNILNAINSGHFICYIKSPIGYWFLIDDSKVSVVKSRTVLSQGAYMLFYSRVHARPSCLEPIEALQIDEHQIVDTTEVVFSHGDTSQGYAADYGDPVSYHDKLGLGTRWDSARDDEMADPREDLSGTSNYFNSWISDLFSVEASSSAFEDCYADCYPGTDLLQNSSRTSSLNEETSSAFGDYYADRINTTLFASRDMLQNFSRRSSLNDVVVSSSDEGEETIQEEESLQEPSYPEDNIPEKLVWEDPTWKPVLSSGLNEEGLRGRSKKRLSESARLSPDDAADESCDGSPKQKMDDEEVQSTATLNIDDSTPPDTPRQPVQQDVTEKEEMDSGKLDKSPKTA